MVFLFKISIKLLKITFNSVIKSENQQFSQKIWKISEKAQFEAIFLLNC